jgi:hypothetical protein
MRLRLLAAVPAVILAACAAAPELPNAEGLVRTPSSQLDQLYLRPNADIASYTRVLVDPVQVGLRDDWATQSNAYNYRVQPKYPHYTDADRLKQEMAELMHADVTEAFRTAGYEAVGIAGPGVVRVAVAVNELFVNAPDRLSPWTTRTATRDAGQARLSLEARDSVSGTVLGRIEHFGLAREALLANAADDVSNRMWFDVMFRRFASNCVAVFGNARPIALSLADYAARP